jgi:hypothetical protein
MALSREGSLHYESIIHDRWDVTATSLRPASNLRANAVGAHILDGILFRIQQSESLEAI